MTHCYKCKYDYELWFFKILFSRMPNVIEQIRKFSDEMINKYLINEDSKVNYIES